MMDPEPPPIASGSVAVIIPVGVILKRSDLNSAFVS
jgi:hypothetical protein